MHVEPPQQIPIREMKTLVQGSGSPRQLTFAQSLRDRAYVAFTASRTF